MSDYFHPEAINDKYLIKSIEYECRSCGNEFYHELALDNGLIKLIEKDGNDVKWLPTFGNGGFLDLVKKLAPEFSTEKFNGIGSVKLEKFLEKELPKYTEKGSSGNGFVIGGSRHICPKCHSKDLEGKNERIIEDPNLDWVRVSCKLK